MVNCDEFIEEKIRECLEGWPDLALEEDLSGK
jgi:hypothetical protein